MTGGRKWELVADKVAWRELLDRLVTEAWNRPGHRSSSGSYLPFPP